MQTETFQGLPSLISHVSSLKSFKKKVQLTGVALQWIDYFKTGFHLVQSAAQWLLTYQLSGGQWFKPRTRREREAQKIIVIEAAGRAPPPRTFIRRRMEGSVVERGAKATIMTAASKGRALQEHRGGRAQIVLQEPPQTSVNRLPTTPGALFLQLPGLFPHLPREFRASQDSPRLLLLSSFTERLISIAGQRPTDAAGRESPAQWEEELFRAVLVYPPAALLYLNI